MLQFSELDFILICSLTYLCVVGTGLGFCAKYKEQFLRSISSDNLQKYNHQNYITPPPLVPSAPILATDSLGIPIEKTKITIQ